MLNVPSHQTYTMMQKIMIGLNENFNHYPAYIFVQKMSSAYYVYCVYSDALRANFIREANTINLDQTVPNGAV